MSGGASRVPACQQHQLTRPRWVFFGDSITQRGSSEQTGWVSQIASVYQRRVDVINRGYSGYNTRWAKALMPHLRDTLYKAQCVTVFFGANDSALKDRTSHSQHVPILEFTSNLTSIVEELRELDVENIILVTPPPVSEPHRIKHAMDTYGITLEKGSERVNAVTQEYAQACERVGKEMGVPVVHLWNSIMESMPETFGDELLNDGLHLTEKGSQYVFQEVLGTIQSSFPALKVDEIPYDVPDCKELMVGDDQEAMRLLQQYLDGLSGFRASVGRAIPSDGLVVRYGRDPGRHYYRFRYGICELNNRAAATMVFGINVLKCWNKKQPSAVASDGCEKETKDTDAQIVECICSSPLLTLCQIDEQDVKERLEEYKDVSNHMIASMGMPQVFDEMSPAEQKRVYQYYLPVYMWCQSQLLEHKKSGKNGGSPLVLGISAPQGCGKSTLCEQLEDVFKYKGWVAASISIDDFYLTRKDQVAVAAKYNGNRLLEMRGNAGSHDVDLGTKTLKALKKATKEGSSVALPRYDKSAFQGKGDRSDPSTWPVVQGPVDVVLFEGWMLGFAHVPKPAAVSVDPDLEAVNGFLKSYKRAWDSHVDSWLVIKVADPQFSYTWRLQAEKRMRESGRPAMTDEEVATFVDRFMPAYKCYLPGLYKDGPTTSIKDKLLMIEVDQHRNPLEKQ